jgi:uncharacterized protein YggT (Ycf19 family)
VMTKFSSAMIAATLWMKQYAFLMSVPMAKRTKPSDDPIYLINKLVRCLKSIKPHFGGLIQLQSAPYVLPFFD